MFLQSHARDRQLPVRIFKSPDGFGLQHAGSGPTQHHLGRALALDVAADQPDHADGVRDDLSAAKGPAELLGQLEANHRQEFVRARQNAAGDAGASCSCLRAKFRSRVSAFFALFNL